MGLVAGAGDLFGHRRRGSAEFDPHGRAPLTRGIEEMRRANVSDDRQAVEDAIEAHACEIVSGNVLDVTHLNNCVQMDGGVLPQARALANILRDMGYQQTGRKRIKLKGAYHYVWFRGRDDDDGDQAFDAVRQWHEGGEDFADVPF